VVVLVMLIDLVDEHDDALDVGVVVARIEGPATYAMMALLTPWNISRCWAAMPSFSRSKSW
jgi:hypothetical protein